jgi:hypothetical protein
MNEYNKSLWFKWDDKPSLFSALPTP